MCCSGSLEVTVTYVRCAYRLHYIQNLLEIVLQNILVNFSRPCFKRLIKLVGVTYQQGNVVDLSFVKDHRYENFMGIRITLLQLAFFHHVSLYMVGEKLLKMYQHTLHYIHKQTKRKN